MGMFDSIIVDGVTCPFCALTSEMEFQTKDLDCRCDVFRQGDIIDSRRRELLGRCSCQSSRCHRAQELADGYRSGFGYVFDARVTLDEFGKFLSLEVLEPEP